MCEVNKYDFSVLINATPMGMNSSDQSKLLKLLKK